MDKNRSSEIIRKTILIVFGFLLVVIAFQSYRVKKETAILDYHLWVYDRLAEAMNTFEYQKLEGVETGKKLTEKANAIFITVTEKKAPRGCLTTKKALEKTLIVLIYITENPHKEDLWRFEESFLMWCWVVLQSTLN